ncbi:hypothetical protein EVAR_102940_1 [Eumeta japonica]|uniref:Mariner Mos1 transposase n=1 Tax=Eumeta variegata TaxID=151549 RepID=A0A4C1UQ76_EUMVA|nr:hypothetical protein EVAR_102940_1 [Eumeta japonica]
MDRLNRSVYSAQSQIEVAGVPWRACRVRDRAIRRRSKGPPRPRAPARPRSPDFNHFENRRRYIAIKGPEFRRGRDRLSDDLNEGPSATAAAETNIDTVRQLIEVNKKITCEQTRPVLGIGMSQVQKDLHVHLKVRKCCIRWMIQYDLTDDRKRVRVG